MEWENPCNVHLSVIYPRSYDHSSPPFEPIKCVALRHTTEACQRPLCGHVTTTVFFKDAAFFGQLQYDCATSIFCYRTENWFRRQSILSASGNVISRMSIDVTLSFLLTQPFSVCGVKKFTSVADNRSVSLWVWPVVDKDPNTSHSSSPPDSKQTDVNGLLMAPRILLLPRSFQMCSLINQPEVDLSGCSEESSYWTRVKDKVLLSIRSKVRVSMTFTVVVTALRAPV